MEKKILVIQTASIGDVILATPVLEGLHAKWPSAVIHILVKKGMEGLFREHPFLGNILVWDKTDKYAEALRLLKRIRRERYEVVINIQRFGLTGFITAFSGAETTVGFSKNPFSRLFTHRIRHLIGEGVHETDRNLSLLSPLPGMEEPETLSSFRRPRLYPPPDSESSISRYRHVPYVTLSPASLWFTKQYPPIKWAELIRALPQKLHIYLLGSRQDHEACQKIILLSGRDNVTDLAGSLNFLESAALMSHALMNYTNDSAPLHLASAVNAPSAVVYCSTVPGFGFGPLSDNRTIVETEKQLDCRPCGLHGKKKCPEKHFECALSIPAKAFPLTGV